MVNLKVTVEPGLQSLGIVTVTFIVWLAPGATEKVVGETETFASGEMVKLRVLSLHLLVILYSRVYLSPGHSSFGSLVIHTPSHSQQVQSLQTMVNLTSFFSQSGGGLMPNKKVTVEPGLQSLGIVRVIVIVWLPPGATEMVAGETDR